MSIDEINKENIKSPDIKLLFEVTKNSYGSFDLDNTFDSFYTINKLLFLVYSTKARSLICYDLVNFNLLTEIKEAHKTYITNIRHFSDEENKKDLIISISDRDNNLKLWNIYNWEIILNIQPANNFGFLCSACLIKEAANNFIISTNCNMQGESDKIKIFDLKGNISKTINDSNEKTYFIDTYYDKSKNKIFLLVGNLNYIKSYDYFENSLYNKYYDEDTGIHVSIAIHDLDKEIKLIESCSDGNIRIWNFHSAILLNKIKVDNDWIFGICLWNEDYLFVACKYKIIKMINIKKGIIEKNIEGHNSGIFTIKKIYHPKYGECLLSQGYENDQIKFWINING